ncbi:MAG: hypothetical protein KIT43_16180 [Bauldia sp.]|nr:hypothetical protein [Bauldia sp.]
MHGAGFIAPTVPIRHSIWHVGAQPRRLAEALLPSEALLEQMIVADPAILSDQWMLIGRQEDTGYGGRIDLLALAPDGALILIELKRGRTPREVVAQALDYATWAEALAAEEIAAIFTRFSSGGSLSDAFRARFGFDLDEATLNQTHQVVIVAAVLDASSERIVCYLNKRDIPINVLCFQVFDSAAGQFLSRAWLLDPVETQVAASVAPRSTGGEREDWNGEYYVSFGHSGSRSWAEARRYNFVCAGGGSWYSGTLRLLKPGDRIWVKAPQYGFVGVGRVRGGPIRAAEFMLPGPDGRDMPAMSLLVEGTYHREFIDDPDRSEYFVPVDWLETVPIENAVDEVGLFGNQNTVCAPKTPKWRQTVERLKLAFPGWDR